MSADRADDAAPPASPMFERMPLLGMLFDFDTRWRAFRNAHRRNPEVDQLHELYRPLAQEANRLGMVDLFTGRFGGTADAREAFARCVDLARAAGVPWTDIVEVVNRSGEAGK